MELTKQTYEALAKITSFEEFEAFMRVATIKGATVKSKFNIFDFCGTDKLRTTMQGVYHDPKHKLAVATDAHLLVMSSDLFKENLQGEIVRKDGTLIKVEHQVRQEDEWALKLVTPNFPNYQMVIEAQINSHTHETDLFEISESYKSELAKFEAKRKAAKEKPEPLNIGIALDTECTLWYPYASIVKFLAAAKHINATHLSYRNSHFIKNSVDPEGLLRVYALIAHGENPKEMVLIMPLDVKPGEEPETAGIAFAMVNDPGKALPTPEDNEKF